MHAAGSRCAAVFCCAAIFDTPLFSAVFRPANAPLHVKIMFSTSLYCPCADRLANAPFQKSEHLPTVCRPPAAEMRLSRGEYAIAPIGWPPPGRDTPRAENNGCGKMQSRSACGTFDERLRGARVDDRRAAGGYSQATRRRSRSEKRGSGERDGKHTVKSCGTPLSLAENRRARRRRKPFCVQYVRLRAFLVTG